jgi:hypothetical protein
MTTDDKYEVVIDIGGSNAKYGYRTVDGPKPRTFDNFKEPSKDLFADRDKVVDTILELFEKKSKVSSNKIETIVFSVTGDMDTVNGKIKHSDRLDEFSKNGSYDGFEWVAKCKEKLSKDCNIHLIHDGFAHAYAAAFQCQTLPLLIVALGTYPNVSVFDIVDEQIKMYSCESFTKAKIYHHGGEKVEVCEILSKHDIKEIKEESKDEKEFTRAVSSRLNVSLKEFLVEYKKLFNGQPGGIVFSGGSSHHLDMNIVQADIDIQVQFMPDKEQMENIFLGCLDYAKRHKSVSLFKC